MGQSLTMRPDFAAALGEQNPFEWAQTVEGKLYRHKEGRRTLRFELNSNAYFLKYHHGIGWGEISKNLTSGKAPVLGARLEWEAMHHLQAIGVDTMTPVAFGERGHNPARQQSFVVTEALDHHISLEDFFNPQNPSPCPVALKRALIRKVATIARTVHDHGLNHCDFYICHFMLDEHAIDQARQQTNPDWDDNIRLHVIDLHRMRKRPRVPTRWLLKDLSALCFSSLDCGLTRRDFLRFIEHYRGKPWRQVIAEESALWRQVVAMAVKLYYKDFKREYDAKHITL